LRKLKEVILFTLAQKILRAGEFQKFCYPAIIRRLRSGGGEGKVDKIF